MLAANTEQRWPLTQRVYKYKMRDEMQTEAQENNDNMGNVTVSRESRPWHTCCHESVGTIPKETFQEGFGEEQIRQMLWGMTLWQYRRKHKGIKFSNKCVSNGGWLHG